MFSQRTLGESVAAVGIGLHSGRKIRLVLRPAPADTGIVFRRVDLEPPVDIPAQPLNVNDTRMATTVNVGRAAVATIEHLMSAFSGLGVDNCIVEVNAPEIPVMDGRKLCVPPSQRRDRRAEGREKVRADSEAD